MSAAQIQDRRINASGETSAKATVVQLSDQFTQITKNIFSQLPPVVSNQANNLGFICTGFETAENKISAL